MVTTIHPVDATSGAPAYGGRMLRQVGSVAYAGASAARPFGAQSGVRPGTSPTTVTATSTTWTVHPHAGLLDLEAAMESGPTPYSVDADVTGPVTAAAGSARIDIVWMRQDIPLEDGTAAPAAVPGYTAGTAGSGVPPTTPARCFVLAWINVPASGGGSPTVTWKATYAVAAGAPTGIVLSAADPAEMAATATGQTLKSANTLITLTPGTWLVTGAACVRTIDVVDVATAIIWNATTAAEVANSRGVGSNVPLTTGGTGLVTRPVRITVTTNTNVQVAAVPNGASTLRLNSLATSNVAWIDAVQVA